MNIVSAVANLQETADYYKQLSDERAEIIKQLVEGPGKIEYIHPFDLYALINSMPEYDYVDILNVKSCGQFVPGEGDIVKLTNGKMYKRSLQIPARTKKLR